MVSRPAEPRCRAVGGRLRGGHRRRAVRTELGGGGKRRTSALEKLGQLAGRGRTSRTEPRSHARKRLAKEIVIERRQKLQGYGRILMASIRGLGRGRSYWKPYWGSPQGSWPQVRNP